MMRRALCFALGLSALSFGATLADEREDKLPEPYRTWLREEVTYIISEVERETFLSLSTEAERNAFIDVFWRKRDQNPATPENEYKTEHYERLAYANEFFSRDTFRPGWQTDRGRFYILLGKPNTRRPLEASDEVYPSELWFYNDPELKYSGLPPFFHLLFFRRQGSGELELYSPLSDGPRALLSGFQAPVNDFRDDVEQAYNKLYAVDVELAQASLSFRTDEGDTAQFQNPAFGTLALLDDIARLPYDRLDTSYAERLDFERGNVESDYLFTYVPSFSVAHVLPGPGRVHYLHWVVELDAENVGFVRDEERGSYDSVFIASLEVVPRGDENRLVLDERRETFTTLSESQARSSLKLPFAYSGMTPLIPGAYEARVILRNRACPSRDESDCFKSYTLFTSSLEVPEWISDRPALSELVLAYGAELLEGDPLYRPYRFGKVEIFPNPRGVYAIGDDLVVAIAALNAPPGSRLRFRISGGASEARTWLEKSVDVPTLGGGPVVQELSLAGFEGGRFELEAGLVDASGAEMARQAAPFVVSPRTAIARPGVRGSIAPPRPEVPGIVSMILAEQHLRLEERDEARARLELAISENPQLGPARELLAGLLLESGEVDSVFTVLDPLVQNVPNWTERYEVLAILGRAYYQKKDYPKAVELLEKAIALRRAEPVVLNALALSQKELGNDVRATEILERSLSLDPNQPQLKELLEKWKASPASAPPRP
jgi:GWxTD domain-containing protein